MSGALLASVGVPLVGAAVLAVFNSKQIRSWLSIAITTVVFGLNIVIFREAVANGGISVQLFSLDMYSPTLRADSLSGVFALLSALVWWAVAWYAPKYMDHEQRPTVFYFFFLVTLGAVQGIFYAGDFVTLLLFFEIMTVTSFFWVIHRQDDEAIRAGYFYLFLGVTAGLLVATGIVLLKSIGVPLAIGARQALPGDLVLFGWASALMIAGFGIKAGMVPMHLWLPMAHPVAPTPGSALLSGILIKCGAYGLIRVSELVDVGHGLAPAIDWLAVAVVVLGLFTMVLGVTLALLQANAKRLLAYHSISQMGYIILGIGVALFLGSEGSLGIAGAVYHSFNHALFKSALFLGIGVVYLYTGELDLYKMGGLWKKLPVTAFLMLLAALGIAGAPGLNGYASKTLLHHAVFEAAHTGVPLMIWAERLFVLVGIGTAASFVKLFYLAFLAKPYAKLQVKGKDTPMLTVGMGILAVVMLVIGFKPDLFVHAAAVPALTSIHVGHLEHLTHVNFWDIHDLTEMFKTLAFGVALCWFGLKTGLFHWHPPTWLSLESLGRLILRMVGVMGRAVEAVSVALTANLRCWLQRRYRRLLEVSRCIDCKGGGVFSSCNFSNLNFDAFLLLAFLAALLVYYFEVEAAAKVLLQ